MKKSILIQGILNITPDSFSDGGMFLERNAAIKRGKRIFDNGADILDIGAESTGPSSSPISVEEELSRLEGIIEKLSPIGVISLDTYKQKTAEFGLARGVQIINDVSGLRASPDMAKVIADHEASVIIMHSKIFSPKPHARAENLRESSRESIIEEIVDFLEKRIEFALKAGIKEKNIILDPGMGGFLSTNPEISWEVLLSWQKLKEKLSPFPLLVATSRKGFLGGNLSQRDPISQITAAHAISKGAKIARTHNVPMLLKTLTSTYY